MYFYIGMTVCWCRREMKGGKCQDVVWRKTIGCVHRYLKCHFFYLVIVYYLLLQMPFVQGCIFCRSCSRYLYCCWHDEGCSIPFRIWYLSKYYQTKSDNFELFFLFTYLKVYLCPVYLSLKWPLVEPM